MIVEICCSFFTLISVATSDFSQTAQFTRQGYREANPIMRPLVKGSNNQGEIATAIATVGAGIALERMKGRHQALATALQWFVIAGHSWAVWHNETEGFEVPVVIFPVIVARW